MESFSLNKNDFIIQCKVQQIVDNINSSLEATDTMTLHVETHADPKIIIEEVQTIRRERNKIVVEYFENNEPKEHIFSSLFHIKKINNMNIAL